MTAKIKVRRLPLLGLHFADPPAAHEGADCSLEITGAFCFTSLDGSNPNWVPIWGAKLLRKFYGPPGPPYNAERSARCFQHCRGGPGGRKLFAIIFHRLGQTIISCAIKLVAIICRRLGRTIISFAIISQRQYGQQRESYFYFQWSTPRVRATRV